jgi:hypothetical protein
VEHIEEQWLENLRIFVHALEIDGVEGCEGEVVIHVVDERAVLSALDPFAETVGEITAEDVRECQQLPLLGIDLIQVANLFVEVTFFLAAHRLFAGLDQDLDEGDEEVQILVRGHQAGKD